MGAAALAYYLAARLGLALSYADTNASPVWPPSGLALAIVLLGRGRLAIGVLCGAFAANVVTFHDNDVADSLTILSMSFSIALGNALEAFVGGGLLRRWVKQDRLFSQPLNVYRFVAVALGVCWISAGIGLISLMAGGVLASGDAAKVGITWWIGDVAGMLVVTPCILAWWRPAQPSGSHRWAEGLACVAGLAILASAIFTFRFADSENRLLGFLLIPCIAWAAFRFQLRGVTLANLIAGSIAVAGTTQGAGPFAQGELTNSLVMLESFVILCSVAGLLLAADMSERHRVLSQESRRIGAWAHWFALMGGMGVAIVGWDWICSDTERVGRERFSTLVTQAQAQLLERINAYEQILRGGAGLFEAAQQVDRSTWQAYFNQLNTQQNFPGMQGFGFAAHVRHAELQAHMQLQRADGLEHYAVFPPGERSEYTPIVFLEPMDWRNRRALAYDMSAERTRRAAIEHARDTGRMTMSGIVHLVQEVAHDRQAGFVMYVPVYRRGPIPQSVDQRRARIMGYVYSPFRARDVVEVILGSQLRDLSFELYDGDAPDEKNLLFRSDPVLAKPDGGLYRSALLLEVGDHNWTAVFRSKATFEAAIDRQKAHIVLLAGTVISLLLFTALRSLAMTRESAYALANQMTAALKRSDQAARANEQRLRGIVEYAPIGMAIVSVGGQMLETNKAFCDMLEYERDVLESLSFQDITHPDDLEAELHQIKRLMYGEIRSYRLEKRYFKKSGQPIWALVTVSMMRDAHQQPAYFISQIEDIDSKKTQEKALQASEQRFRILVEAVHDHAIIMLDPQGCVSTWNNGAQRVMGYTSAEVIGLHFACFFVEDDLTTGKPALELQRAQELGHFEDEGWRLRKDGSRFWANIGVTALRQPNGELLGFVKITRDLTERKQREQAIETALKEKDTLLREVYHRVKNNLQVVTSLFNLQLRALPEGEAREALVQSASRVRAMALVHEKLYQSKNLSSISLPDYIADLCQQLSVSCGVDVRGISLKVEIEPMDIGLEKAVPLGLLMNELILNSLKHGFPPGRGGHVYIRLFRDGDQAVLEVKDDGVGLAEGFNFEKCSTLGFKLVRTLSAQLDGTVQLTNQNGAVALIRFSSRFFEAEKHRF